MTNRSLGTPFWRLFVSLSGSNLADGIGRTALPLLATTLTRDPLAISGLVTLAFLPWLLFALPSGVLVDRVDRRRAMAAANVFRAVVVGCLGVAVLVERADIAALYVVAFLLGAAETVYDSAARAVLPGIVGRDQLDRANSFLVTAETIGERFLGAPVGAFLFAVAAAAPFLINSAGFLLAALLIIGIGGGRRPPAREPSTLRVDVRVGVTWLRSHHAARDLMLVTVAIVAAGVLADAVLVLYVLEDLGVPEAAFGVFLIAGAVGGLLGGGLAAGLARRVGRVGALVLASGIGGVSYVALGLTRAAALGAVLLGVYGATVMVWNVLSMSIRQALIPNDIFGRVQGAWRTLVWGVIPVSSLLGGTLASLTDVATVFLVSGALQVLAAGAAWAVLRRHRAEIAASFAPAPTPVAVPS